MPGKHEAFINGMSPVTSESDGTVVGFADVCLTPSPSGPVPIPYANVAKSEDLEEGSRTVRIGGAAVCLSNSCLGSSTGNESGTLGGVSSGTTKGRAHPVTFSPDVKIEGRSVVRNFDLFTLNERNVPPFAIVQPQGTAPTATQVNELSASQVVERCSWCGKEKHPFDTKGRVGSNQGSSAVLGRNMLEGQALATHTWYAGPFSLAAHHLICLEALDKEDWALYCARFGYHPDRKQNGVFLPMKLALACQLFVPVHRGNHADGLAIEVRLSYPRAVMKQLKAVEAALMRGAFCSKPEALLDELDRISEEILAKVACFRWTLTRDGLDYAPGGVGCAGLKSIRQKPGQGLCPHGRRHSLVHAVSRLSLGLGVLRVGG
ncbi:PAAR-like domain-containing protein [Myxococcus qinghaiensis]|uniref:PAAR-like domain-containing protein n=1 Tax=Myxococcus qinghaiensis TaxID=2906758 RepID=UPI0020A79D75|nr:PAAR-like domain-containing protein [Myxococcus qinghaiensis]MCP3165756.1 DUF4150 domain-containing protein [Myxococcus qinghaiensis]